MLWAEIAHQMAALPLLILVGMLLAGERRDAGWWWLAIAFFVSWIADSAADFLPKDDRWPISIAYPVSQAGLIVAVLLPRREALVLSGLLVCAGLATSLWRGAEGPDVLLRSVAFLAVAGIAWSRWDLPLWLRPALLCYFFGGWVAWMIHAHYLVIPTWFLNQSVRLAGLSLFCVAFWRASPRLKLVRAS